jgi:hypothetical protein
MADDLEAAAAPAPTEDRGRLVPVVDLDGRPLTPCSPARAAQNVAEGLAVMRADGTLWLRYRPLAYRRVFREVRRRDGLRCGWCGAAGSTLDHVIPVCWGGQARRDNCVVACRSCNHARNNLLPSRFREILGVDPRHPVIRRVLADEAALVAAADAAILTRAVETCRSKEEAQVWAAFHTGHADRINREPPRELVTRLKASNLEPHPRLYVP